MSTMGNLFSGSGAWELAAKMCGIDVVFEAEIELFPVAVEAKRFPEAIQLGDVSKINGADIPPVDIFTNSSPCQGLSVAGRRKGLEDERSGLFAEAVRITKEMREHDRNIRGTDDVRPRFWCWENVPGAFSSSGGEDFRIVLEEVARIADPTVVIPKPSKWSTAGVVDGNGWQIAWRTLDAQHYGVAQRRRRVFLSADFGGHRAAEILFEREGVSWNYAAVAETWQETSRSLGDRIEAASRVVRGGVSKDGHAVGDGYLWGKVGALCEADYKWVQQQQGEQGKIIPVKSFNQISQSAIYREDDKSVTLSCCGGSYGGGSECLVVDGSSTKCYGISSYHSNSMKSPNPDSGIYEAKTSRTLDLNGGSPACNQGGMMVLQRHPNETDTTVLACFEGNGSRPSHRGPGITTDAEKMYTLNVTEVHGVVEQKPDDYIVRRLTPTECARLQGFPDDWCSDVPHSDSEEYRLWGNGISLPCILPMVKAMADVLEEKNES